MAASSVMSGAGVSEQLTWGGDDQRPPAPSALRAVSVATGNWAACGTGQPSQVVKTEWAADRWARSSKIYFSNFQTLVKLTNSKRKLSHAEKMFKLSCC
jgi:hypothetical protein